MRRSDICLYLPHVDRFGDDKVSDVLPKGVVARRTFIQEAASKDEKTAPRPAATNLV